VTRFGVLQHGVEQGRDGQKHGDQVSVEGEVDEHDCEADVLGLRDYRRLHELAEGNLTQAALVDEEALLVVQRVEDQLVGA